jgi:hypothetical protein
MKKFCHVAVCTATLMALVSRPAPAQSPQPFQPGSLVVQRLGDGTAVLSNAAAQISILEVTTAGSLTQTITLATTGSDAETGSGSAGSEGLLNTYFSGTVGFLSVPGYNAAVGTTSVGSATTVARINSTLDGSGAIVGRTVLASGTGTPFYTNNFRSSIATSGTTFYGFGAGSGVGGCWYVSGTQATQVAIVPTSMRNGEIYNGQLFFSSNSTTGGTFVGINSLGTGLPTASATASLVINTSTSGTGTGASPYGFVMFSTGSQGAGVLDLAYIADDRAVTGGGLQKWTLSGTTWSNAWSLLVSGTSNGLAATTTTNFGGLRGLAGTWDATTGATLYATTASGTQNNSLISIVDTGFSTPTSYTALLSSGTNYIFRGVDFSPVPVPEPSTLALAGLGLVAAYASYRRRRRSTT